jgi:mannosyltransferase
VFEIPRWVEAPPKIDEAAVAALRQRLQIPQDAVVIGCFGPMRAEKRIRPLLEAVRAVSVPYSLLLAGSFDHPEYETALRPLLQSAPVVRLPYPAGEDRWRLAQLTDIAVSLSDPSAGQTSPAVLRWMAAGKPVLVTDGEENSSFPAASVIRVDPGEAETEMLAHYLYALAGEKEMRDAVGVEARRHVLQNHTLELAARRYHDAVREVMTD